MEELPNLNKSQRETLRGFYTFVRENLPEGFLEDEDTFPVIIGNNTLNVVIIGFDADQTKVRFGIYLNDTSKQPVPGGSVLEGHEVGEYARKTLQIDPDGYVTEEARADIPAFDLVKDEPDFGELTNEEIAVQIVEQIQKFKRPGTN